MAEKASVLRSRKIGIVLSAGGSSFFEAVTIAKDCGLQFFVVVDRQCPAIDECRRRSIPFEHVPFETKALFSAALRDVFAREKANGCLLLFSRLIGPELYQNLECLNVHPSFLPSFPGLAPVQKASNAGVKFIGATLHRVDETVDGGPIMAQTVTPIGSGAEIGALNRVSFLQKTLLVLRAFEYFSGVSSDGWSPRMNPTLARADFVKGFSRLQESLGVDVFP